METTLHIDTANLADLLAAQSLIEALVSRASADVANSSRTDPYRLGEGHVSEGEPETPPGKEELVAVLSSVVVGYEYNRQEFLRAVAEGGDWGVRIRDQLANHFKGDGRAMGGTRSSIQKKWAASGGQNFALFLIEISDDEHRYVMYAPARPIVLELLAEIDEADQPIS